MMKMLQISRGNIDIAIHSTGTIGLPYRLKNKSNSLPQKAKQKCFKWKKQQLNVKIHTHFLKPQEENYLSNLIKEWFINQDTKKPKTLKKRLVYIKMYEV